MFTKRKKPIAAVLMPHAMASTALASSHREAPFIAKNPKVDATDFYMFRSYEAGKEAYVTLMANYLPLQDPYGGPNFFTLDPKALYEIHIDNNGDAKEDLTFAFRFQTGLKDMSLDVGGKQISVPLINLGAIMAGDTANLNVTETYTVDVVRGHRRTGVKKTVKNADTGATTFMKPVDNIGNKSIPDYPAYAASHIHNIDIPGCATRGRMFVGQRDDPFGVNLGEVFDLINTNPIGPVDGEVDILDDKNVTALILEVPISCLASASDPVIAGWTTASVRKSRVIHPGKRFTKPSMERGPFRQVSRLGMPLVNELVIGIKDKDRFNASQPVNDAQFADYVTNPTLPEIIQILFPVTTAPNIFPRPDMVSVFLTGVDGVNKTGATAEMLRLNTALPPTAAASQNNLGAALCFVTGTLTLANPGCDPAGFPNGRRPGDDVVDIALRVAMGYLLPLASAPTGQLGYTDGALVNSAMFDSVFPYLKTPLPGSPN